MKKSIERSFLLSILICYVISTDEDLVSDTCPRPNSTHYDYVLEDCRYWTSSFADGKIFLRYFRFRSIFFNPFREFVFDLIRFDSKRALASRMHLIQVDLGVFIKFFQDISGSGQFFSIHFVNLFLIWFKKGACFKDASDSSWFGGIYKLKPTTLRVSQIHLESKILIFVTKLRPRLP